MSFHLNILVCGDCPHRQRPCLGSCLCTVDSAESIAHAQAGYCADPAGPRFGDGEKPTGWDASPQAVAFQLHRASDEEIAAAAERAKNSGCNC